MVFLQIVNTQSIAALFIFQFCMLFGNYLKQLLMLTIPSFAFARNVSTLFCKKNLDKKFYIGKNFRIERTEK